MVHLHAVTKPILDKFVILYIEIAYNIRTNLSFYHNSYLHKVCNILTLLATGGQNLPMARKYRNSSNSAEFGALALLDFSPFVITKP